MNAWPASPLEVAQNKLPLLLLRLDVVRAALDLRNESGQPFRVEEELEVISEELRVLLADITPWRATLRLARPAEEAGRSGQPLAGPRRTLP